MKNMIPPPMSDTEFRREITKLLLGDDWCVAFPVSQEQANTCIYDEIKFKYKRNIFKRNKLWTLLKSLCKIKN